MHSVLVDCSEELKAALRAPGHDGKFCSTNKRQIALLWNSALDAELAVARDHHHRELDEATADHQQRLSQTEARAEETQERVQQALEHHQQQLGVARCEYQRDLDAEIVRHREELNEIVCMKAEHMTRLVDQDGTQKQQFLQLINKLHDGNRFFSIEISSSAKQELASSIRQQKAAIEAAATGIGCNILINCVSQVSENQARNSHQHQKLGGANQML
jgi:hypothetical protein